MVAPAGVNEEGPQEPVKAGAAPVELAEGPAAEAEPGLRLVLAEAVPSPSRAGGGGAGRSPGGGAEPKPRKGSLAEAGPSEAEPGRSERPGRGRRREESRDVSPLAVAGIILGILALVGVAVGVLAVVTHGFRPKTVITYRPAAVFGLRPGQCIDSGGNGLTFTVLSCAAPHDAEVFATFSLPAARLARRLGGPARRGQRLRQPTRPAT